MNRRDVLLGAAKLTPVMLAGTTAMRAGAETPSGWPEAARKFKIIVAGGHPGDAEYGCGGTIARFTALGHEVVLLHLMMVGGLPLPQPLASQKPQRPARY